MMLELNFDASIDNVVAEWRKFLESQRAAILQAHTDRKSGQLSWSRAVELAHNDNAGFLRQYGKLREKIVNDLLAIAFRRASQKHGNRMCEACKAQAVGSQSLTSDYDITVFGPQSPTIVAEFYRLFRKLFVAEPGRVFDTNVYGGPNFFHVWRADELQALENASLLKSVFVRLQTASNVTKKSPRLNLSLKEHRGDSCAHESVALRTYCLSTNPTACQDLLSTLQPLKCEQRADCERSGQCSSDRCWAFVAFFRFFVDDASMRERALRTLKSATKSSKLAQADWQNFSNLQSELDSDRERVTEQKFTQTCLSISQKRSCEETNYYLALIARAESAQRDLFKSIESGAPLADQLPRRDALRYAVSHAALYGSEMYVTCGAVLHIVVAQQMGLEPPLVLTADDLLASFLENAGFALNIIFKTTGEGVDHVTLPFAFVALINASKYVARLLDARHRFCEHFESAKKGANNCTTYDAAAQVAENVSKRARKKKVGSKELSVQQAMQYGKELLEKLVLTDDGDWQSLAANKQTFVDAFDKWLARQLVQMYNCLHK